MIDERTRAALARLTENERACLARRLDHQTAKEMAIDLGISPHAVEKRLKMARTKLGLSSSLEAAQLLAASEGYGQMGPQAPDLGAETTSRQDSVGPLAPRPAWRWIAPYVLTGVLVMSLAVIALLAVAPMNAPQSGVAPSSDGGAALLSDSGPSAIGEASAWRKEYNQGHGKLVLIKATPEQIKAFVADAFDDFDKDRSGFIEPSEVPPDGLAIGLEKISASMSQEDIAAGKGAKPLDGKAGQRAWIGLWDKNRDGKLSRQEFADGLSLDLLRAGGVPEGWPGVPPARDGDGRKIVFEDIDSANLVPASPAIVRAFVNSSFDSMDKDHSGFIERREAPPWPVGNIRFTGPADLPSWHDDTVGRAVWIARADTDGDGRISRDEFMAVTYPIFASRGVPANWPGAPKVAAK